MKQDVQTIAELIGKAKSAHQAFEFAMGKADPDWAMWYAKHMLDNGLETNLSDQEIANMLMVADDNYQQTGRVGEWKLFFATFLKELQ